MSGTASIIVDHDIAPCTVVACCWVESATDRCAKGTRRVGPFARPHWGKLGNFTARPIEIPIDAGRVAETPKSNADSGHAGAVVADRATGEHDDARGDKQG